MSVSEESPICSTGTLEALYWTTTGAWMPGGIKTRIKFVAGHDLRDREIEIYVGLKEDLLNRNAVEGLRLDIPDPVHARRQRILAVGRDPLLHLRRAQSGILPDDGDDRDVDLGKDVRRHRQHGGRAEKQDEHSQHVEGMRQPQSKTNDTHDDRPVRPDSPPGNFFWTFSFTEAASFGRQQGIVRPAR